MFNILSQRAKKAGDWKFKSCEFRHAAILDKLINVQESSKLRCALLNETFNSTINST